MDGVHPKVFTAFYDWKIFKKRTSDDLLSYMRSTVNKRAFQNG